MSFEFLSARKDRAGFVTMAWATLGLIVLGVFFLDGLTPERFAKGWPVGAVMTAVAYLVSYLLGSFAYRHQMVRENPAGCIVVSLVVSEVVLTSGIFFATLTHALMNPPVDVAEVFLFTALVAAYGCIFNTPLATGLGLSVWYMEKKIEA